ncbi:protein of unknown function [Chitinophaga sp. YR573]|uniref:DUF5000 domain-containing lipoprotein n=1 Tax=Chitinophaga sp. YR573 TaxID=1881040 RepID=UPI0008CD64D4|nr:DUF5000 domain-containing lipoprotein [Chitinophaga sp. YR573]SEW36049.1 protein of unknown function [Chitinophaga sp. YR573]
MRLIKLSYITLLLIVVAACKRDELNKPIVTNTNPPGLISGISVVNLNGKATLTYTLPADEDLSYVKAVYETSPGQTREVKASHYVNTLTVDGFGDTLAHTIKLYSVNSSEVSSGAVTATVDPLTPAVDLALRSLQVVATFGGFNLTCNNPTLENLAIIPLVDSAGKGQWIQTVGMDNVYSNSPVITSAVRGQPAVERTYAFVVRDRWLNFSDTLFVKLTPIFEQLLPKSDWSNYVLPNDATILNNGGRTDVPYIYDGNFHPGWPQCLFTVEQAGSSQMVTLDLGKAHILSRMQVNPYLEVGNNYYVRGNVKDFEIWASNSPDLSGSLDPSWTKLTTCHVMKPSGSAYATETTADQTLAYNGWQFDFPAGQIAYRYIRIRSLSNWQGSYFINIAEFTLWGN